MLQCDKPGECDKLDCFDCEWAVDEEYIPEHCKTCGLAKTGCDQECEICPGINA